MMTNVFRPSAEFIKRMSSQYGAGALERYIDRVQKEFEIYEYFATHPPKELDDHDWKRMLRMQSISERITHFDFLAKIKYEDERAAARRAEEKRETEERLAKERERYDAGGMGYGPGLYQLLPPPRRSQRLKNLAAGCRVWKSLRLNEQDQLPTISWDMQFMGQETVRQQYELAGHLKTVIGLNYELKNPFPMQLINIDAKVVTEEMFQEKIGHYGKYVNQVITPDRLTSNPLEKCASDPGTIYISKYAPRFIDEPLTNFKNVIVPLTYDSGSKSIGAFRRHGFRAVRLPFDKYLKWGSGSKAVPFATVLRIFDEVCQNGGDWKTALEKFVSKRYFHTHEERKAIQGDVWVRHYEKRRLKAEIEQTIIDAIGQPRPDELLAQKSDASPSNYGTQRAGSRRPARRVHQ